MIQIIPIAGLPEVLPGDDLPALLRARMPAGVGMRDILVVAQKIVSKAEACFVELDSVTPCSEALRLAAVTRKDARLVELVLRESTAVVRAVPHVLITRHHCGFVMANAGIDQSNLGPDGTGRVLLLPRDPDANAARIREALGESPPAVVISDSFGRPWRYGVVNIAIGACGMPSLIDRRGQRDRDGRTLEVTQIALADAVAAAAGMAMGEGSEGIPAVLVRGLDWTEADAPAAALVRPLAEDLFQ
mgnify:FL=1